MAKPKGYPATPASFKKGISGNPSGKPKDHKFFLGLLKQRYNKALKVIDDALDSNDLEYALPAAKFVAGYVLGKPSSNEDGKNVEQFIVNFNKFQITSQPNPVKKSFLPQSLIINGDTDAISH